MHSLHYIFYRPSPPGRSLLTSELIPSIPWITGRESLVVCSSMFPWPPATTSHCLITWAHKNVCRRPISEWLRKHGIGWGKWKHGISAIALYLNLYNMGWVHAQFDPFSERRHTRHMVISFSCWLSTVVGSLQKILALYCFFTHHVFLLIILAWESIYPGW